MRMTTTKKMPEIDGVRWNDWKTKKSLHLFYVGHPKAHPQAPHKKLGFCRVSNIIILYRSELTGSFVLITFYYAMEQWLRRRWTHWDEDDEEDICLSRISINQSGDQSDSYYAKSKPSSGISSPSVKPTINHQSSTSSLLLLNYYYHSSDIHFIIIVTFISSCLPASLCLSEWMND